MTKQKKLTGVAVPLGALYTKSNQIIGEYPDLIPFANFCKSCNLELIQLLPVNDTGTQSSPYSGLSAFALHPIYIRLCQVPGFSTLYSTNPDFKNQYDEFEKNNKYTARYDYDNILNTKISLLQKLYNQTEEADAEGLEKELQKFINANGWVKTYAVYKNLKWKYIQASWKSWDKEDQNMSEQAITALWNKEELKKDHLFYVWCQLIAANQFSYAVEEVHKLGILLKGDMPILMNEDSCDTWSLPQYFNQNLRAGAPADGENPTGQNWGFPTYNWKNLKTDNYSWWISRLKTASNYYDAYRLDHILGFFRIWSIPQRDCNALNGHTEPFAAIKRDDLLKAGFDPDRLRWLSQPHIPTYVIEEVTWNHDVAHRILELICNRIGQEELWLFKDSIKGSQDIWDADFGDLCDGDAAYRIKDKLVNYWSNRTLLEVEKNKFVFMWTYGQSTSYQSLNETEKETLAEFYEQLNKKNEKLWKKQAEEIFTTITERIKMIPCGEDLGVGIKCVPEVMKKQNILGLRVVRWCRYWDKEKQPYVPFEKYEPLSVTTTSVHDSSTIRQWWEENQSELEEEKREEFSEDTAFDILKNCSESASMWYIPPLQDFLYLNKKYWLETAEEERINIPGTVTKFNWTYRMPVSIEELSGDSDFIKSIKEICKR